MKLSRRSFIKYSVAGIALAKLIPLSHLFAAVKQVRPDKKIFVPGLAKASEFINQKNGKTFIAGYPVQWWIDKYGLPLTINYAPDIRKNIRGFKNVFTKYYPKGDIRYAVKANAHPTILSLVNEEGAGADVASENEAKCALQGNIDPEHIDVNGNSKSEALIEMALKKNMHIVADNIEEFLVISALAKKHMSKPKDVLRLAGYDLKNVTDEGVFTAGKWCKFGASIKDLPRFYSLLPKHPHIDFLGFHTHIGSQITAIQPYSKVLGKLIEFSKALNEKGGKCRLINIGGGFPVSYFKTRKEWDEILELIRNGYIALQKGDDSKVWIWGGEPAMFMDQTTGKIDLKNWIGEESYSEFPQHLMLEAIFKNNVTINGQTMNAVKALKSIGEPTIVVEPGRAIAETSGVSLMKVTAIRKIPSGHNMIAVDAGSVNYADSIARDYLMRRWTLAENNKETDKEPFDAFVAGRLCFNADIICRIKKRFPRKPKENEAVLIHNAGAYCSQFFAANTNSFARPARVICYEDGSVAYIRKKDTYDEIFSQ